MPTLTLHLVRHAQGFHNLSHINEQIPDPYLTPLGRQQCADLRASFPHHARITHLVASPMRRTLLTAYHGFYPPPPSSATRSSVIIAQPLIQEVSANPCDVGSRPAVLQAEFGEWMDGGLLTADWSDKRPGSRWEPRVEKLAERAREARVWLRELARASGGDADVVVVTHGGILHFLTEDWDGMDYSRGTGWANTEWRSYEFVDPDGSDDQAHLRETPSSWRRRRGSATPLTETEQQQARAAVLRTMMGWNTGNTNPSSSNL